MSGGGFWAFGCWRLFFTEVEFLSCAEDFYGIMIMLQQIIIE